MIPHAPCTINCNKKAPTISNASDGANAHNGTTAIAHSNAVIIDLRRPQRSDMNPNRTPPRIAPTIDITVTEILCRGLKPQWRSRNVGYMSWVPWETKFIIIINRVR